MRTKKSRSKINSYDNNVDKKVKKLSHPVNTPYIGQAVKEKASQ